MFYKFLYIFRVKFLKLLVTEASENITIEFLLFSRKIGVK